MLQLLYCYFYHDYYECYYDYNFLVGGSFPTALGSPSAARSSGEVRKKRGVQGLGFRDDGSGFNDEGSGFRV